MVPPAFNSREKPVKKHSDLMNIFYGDSGPKSESELSSSGEKKQCKSSLS
jgi:hypothetical protein